MRLQTGISKRFPTFCNFIIHERNPKINLNILIFSTAVLSFSRSRIPRFYRTDKSILKKAKYIFTSPAVCATMYAVEIGDSVKSCHNYTDNLLLSDHFSHFNFVVFYQLSCHFQNAVGLK